MGQVVDWEEMQGNPLGYWKCKPWSGEWSHVNVQGEIKRDLGQ